ncbi:hypothetical protein DFAR_3760001 [Desulfarculales bacterium]
MTLEEHTRLILTRWTSNHPNARLEGLNGIFQTARARARGYRKAFIFMTMIYLIAVPLTKNYIILVSKTQIMPARNWPSG